MKSIIGICIGICLANPAWAASDSLSSEMSHVVGGALTAGVGTAVADRYWPEHRALIGFTAGVTAQVLGEVFSSGGGWNGKHSMLDAASGVIGAAIGAVVTDKFILMPVVRREHGGQYQYYGVVGQYRF